MDPLLIAVLSGLGGMIGWGFADFFAKKTIDKIGDVVSMVWAHVFGTVVFGIFLLVNILVFNQPVGLPSNINTWLLVIVFGALQAAVYLTAYQGFGKGPLSVLNPIFASYSGLAALISILFFGENISMAVLSALVIIFVGVIMTNLDIEHLKARRLKFALIPGVKEMVIAALLAAFWTVFWDSFISEQSWLTYAFLMYVFMSITAYLVARFRKINLSPKKITGNLWVYLALIGICEAIAYVSISLGFGLTTETSVVAVLSGAFSLPTIILARAFLKERPEAIQVFGSAVIIVGIVLISLL